MNPIPQDLQQDYLYAGHRTEHADYGKPWWQLVRELIERIARLEAELAQEKEIGFATSAELEAVRTNYQTLLDDAVEMRKQIAAKDGEIAALHGFSETAVDLAAQRKLEIDSLKAQLSSLAREGQ